MSRAPRETPQERRDRLDRQATEGPTRTPAEHRRQSRRSVLTGAAALGAGALSWRWVQTQPTDHGIPVVLRNGHEANERLWRALGSDGRAAPEYDVAKARPLRVNGRRGIEDDIDVEAWRLQILDGNRTVLDELVLDDIRTHDEVQMVTEHKCVEGWSTIAHWTGVRLADVVEPYREEAESSKYVAMATPDDRYYVGLERGAALHPQSLLVYALDGEELTPNHGAPLRLVTPNHYGVKSIKRLGSIQFTNDRPRDYWAERGYDWYSRF